MINFMIKKLMFAISYSILLLPVSNAMDKLSNGILDNLESFNFLYDCEDVIENKGDNNNIPDLKLSNINYNGSIEYTSIKNKLNNNTGKAKSQKISNNQQVNINKLNNTINNEQKTKNNTTNISSKYNTIDEIIDKSYSNEQMQKILSKPMSYYINELNKSLNILENDLNKLNDNVKKAKDKFYTNIQNNRFTSLYILHNRIMTTTKSNKLSNNFGIDFNILNQYKTYYNQLISNIWNSNSTNELRNFNIRSIAENSTKVLIDINNKLNRKELTKCDISTIKDQFLDEKIRSNELKGNNMFKIIANLACYILDWNEYVQATYEKYLLSPCKETSTNEYKEACKQLGTIFKSFKIK